MIINRRPIRASLGSRRVRRFGVKSAGKTPPRVEVAQKVRKLLAKRSV